MLIHRWLTNYTDLLRQLDSFIPRVKPSQRQTEPDIPELAPLRNVKRDIVRLIGILSFDDPAVGDQVRQAEGVQLILSMTEVDESNPCQSTKPLVATSEGGHELRQDQSYGNTPCSPFET